MASITAAQIDAVLPFLTKFEDNGFSAGTWSNKPGQLPWFQFDETVTQFQQMLYGNGWVKPFDWKEWQDTAQGYVDLPEMIESADVETIQKLFTTHVRKERFCEGHLAAMFKNGHIVSMLRRLNEIKNHVCD